MLTEEKEKEIKEQYATKIAATPAEDLKNRVLQVLSLLRDGEFFPNCWDVAIDTLFVEALSDRIVEILLNEDTPHSAYKLWRATQYQTFQDAAASRNLQILSKK